MSVNVLFHGLTVQNPNTLGLLSCATKENLRSSHFTSWNQEIVFPFLLKKTKMTFDIHHVFFCVCVYRVKEKAELNQQLTNLLPNKDVSTNKDPATV